MLIDLKEAKFENDMFSVSLPKEGEIVFNSVNESLLKPVPEGDMVVKNVNRINIQIHITREDKVFYANCSSIIGFKDSITEIQTEYKELEGQLLTKENMLKCKVVVDA